MKSVIWSDIFIVYWTVIIERFMLCNFEWEKDLKYRIWTVVGETGYNLSKLLPQDMPGGTEWNREDSQGILPARRRPIVWMLYNVLHYRPSVRHQFTILSVWDLKRTSVRGGSWTWGIKTKIYEDRRWGSCPSACLHALKLLNGCYRSDMEWFK